MRDVQLLLILAVMHLVAIAAAAGLILWALRSQPVDAPSDDQEGGGGGVRPNPPDRPRGGPPLPDADPARVRLRQRRRLADLLPRAPRRGPREPVRRPVPRTVHDSREDLP